MSLNVFSVSGTFSVKNRFPNEPVDPTFYCFNLNTKLSMFYLVEFTLDADEHHLCDKLVVDCKCGIDYCINVFTMDIFENKGNGNI